MVLVYVELVLEDGELIYIECPQKFCEALHSSLDECIKRKDVWSLESFDGCSAKYLGHYLRRVNMARVVGML